MSDLLDPQTVATVGTAATQFYAAMQGTKVLEKILGPTADYLGQSFKDYAQKAVENLNKVFQRTADCLGDALETPGSVPPKLLMAVLREGSVCEDPLTTDYLGALLASGRTAAGRDDRATTYVNLTGQLSSYQVRLHYIAYTQFRRLFAGRSLRTTIASDLSKMAIFVPMVALEASMDLDESEASRTSDIMTHCVTGLERLGLLRPYFWGSRDHCNSSGATQFKTAWREVSDAGFVFGPTAFGMEYYLAAMAAGTFNYGNFLDKNLHIEPVQRVKIDGDTHAVVNS